MGVLFISHSSQDNDQAIKVRDWLKSQGWGEVFLDLDPEKGLSPGQVWEDELKRAGENCSGIVMLISPNWVNSPWCQAEFLATKLLGKRFFPMLIAPTPREALRFELRGLQFADISTPETEAEGFQRLAHGLRRAGLDPNSFDWPPPGEPNRSVYRGLSALDVQDAAIFFGRDAAITLGLDELRRLRDGAPKRVLVILGASGAGKSSFLRAGLIARLKRDEENFLVLPIIRPERAAVSGAQGLAASLSSASGRSVALNSAAELAQAFAELRRPVVERLTRNAEAARETYSAKPPTVVIPIDQAEELFGAENTERAAFCDMLANALGEDGNALVVATMRTDSYESLQKGWLPESQTVMTLPPIATGSFQQIIEGPARLAKPPLTVEPTLTQRLLADLDAADALPLLAFTLERLTTQYGADGKLTLADYRDKLGGLSGAIQSAVAAVLGGHPSKEKLALVRRLFVPALVQVDQDGVKRRVARRADLPTDTQALADQFVAQRLLVTDDGGIEVAHEAILRQWPTLNEWLSEEHYSLRTLESLRAAAREWRNAGEYARVSNHWLSHQGERLKDAEAVVARRDLANAVSEDMREYLAACRKSERRAVAVRVRLRALAATALLAVIGAGFAFATQDEWQPQVDAWWNYKRYVHSAEELLAGPTGAGSAFQDCRHDSTDCPVMVVIPEGSAIIGAAADDPELGGSENALPLQRVTMPRFAVSQHEITWADWRVCVAARRCPELDRGWEGGGSRPVMNVSWVEAHAYAEWLEEVTGEEYRLLTEQEWEYAARGVTSTESAPTRFTWGDEDPVCDPTAENGAAFYACEQQGPWPVGSFQADAFGLYDMHGNAWEWTEACFDGGRSSEQSEMETNGCSSRVLRGGSWDSNLQHLRSAYRYRITPPYRYLVSGFRIARTLSGGEAAKPRANLGVSN
jgi:formylglycine-generating enzyme required for sulfatase activity